MDYSKKDKYFSNMDATGINSAPQRIGVFPVPGFALMSYASLVEPFRGANLLSNRPLYDLIHITQGPDVQSSGASFIVGDHRVGEAIALDYLFVIAGGDPVAFEHLPTLDWLGRMARTGAQMGGVSGGPVILARAGLMGGRRMTVHWEHADALAEISPGLLIERSLYVIDRDRVTCAGGTAPLDLANALIARDHGAVFARLVSDWFLHTEVRPSGGPQRGGLVERVGTAARPVLDAIEAMENHIADPLSLSHLATICGVTERHLNRVFKEKLGCSTMAYYRRMRLEIAQRLLAQSPLSITDIALTTGFANSAHFSRIFSGAFGHPPSRVRTRLAPVAHRALP